MALNSAWFIDILAAALLLVNPGDFCARPNMGCSDSQQFTWAPPTGEAAPTIRMTRR